MATYKHLFDLSDFPEEQFLNDKTTKGSAHDDRWIAGESIEWSCLKLWSIQFEGDVKPSAKRVEKVSKTLNHELFKECLLNRGKVKRFKTKLRSKNHQIVVNCVHKVALSSYDDKRYVLIRSHTDTTKMRDIQAAMVNLSHIFW